MSLRINLHYGPSRLNCQRDGMFLDHPFSRLMPEEIVSALDRMVKMFHNSAPLNVALVEEYPFTYLRYLVRMGILESEDVHIYWHEKDERRELRLGGEGELLDPWPTGFFDRSLEFTLVYPTERSE